MHKILIRYSAVPGKLIFFIGIQCLAICSYAQYYGEEPEPELAMGIKVVSREILYGSSHLYTTDQTSIALQPVFRYDYPLKISTKRYTPHYIDLVGQAGFLFCKAKVFDTAFFDPNTNIYVHHRSSNPTYLPLYFGVYNMAAFSIGAEIFYWKGLGNRDIWGAKFLSLGYNGRQFRVSVAGELYAQVRNSKNRGTVFSVDIFVKLIKGY